MRDGARIIRTAADVNTLAATVEDNGGVYFVPALTGLGAPYWDQYARGAFFGITRGTTDGHMARATLEGIAFQVYDIVKAMEADAGQETVQLRVDGGACQSDYLMQTQAEVRHIWQVWRLATGTALMILRRNGKLTKYFSHKKTPKKSNKCCIIGIKLYVLHNIGLKNKHFFQAA